MKPVNSRNKGASFERQIAAELQDRLGIKFVRDLEQVRMSERGDLLADDPAWPFTLECKRYASGTGCKAEWQAQAAAAAKAARNLPAVIYKFDRRDVRVSVPFAALFRGDDTLSHWADLSLEGFCLIAAEIMAERAMSEAAE